MIADVASQCLHDEGYEQLESSKAVIQLTKALDFDVSFCAIYT